MARDPFVVGLPLGRWQTNCCVVGDRATERAVVIDPGEGAAEAVPPILDEHGVRCEALLLTHGHIDHIWGAPALARALDVPVLLHPDDRWLWDEPLGGMGVNAGGAALTQLLGAPWDPPSDRLEPIADGQRFDVAGIGLLARHTPGHTPGHVTFLASGLAGAELWFWRALGETGSDLLFSGDLVFAGSVGRTDFPRGSHEQLLDSIARTVLELHDDVLVLPGHGPETTVGRERRANPFLRGLRQPARGL